MQDNPPYIDDSTLIFQSRDELAIIDLTKVAYFESDSNYTKVCYTNDCSVLIIASLSFVENLLNGLKCSAARKFIRVGRFLIINTEYLFRINTIHQQLMLTDGIRPQPFTLKASKPSLRQLKNLYKDRAIVEGEEGCN